MLSSIGAWLHGWTGVAVGYGAVQAPMVAEMLRRRVSRHLLLAAPLVAIPVTAASGTALALFKPLFNNLGAAASLSEVVLGTAVSAGLGYLSGRVLSTPSGVPVGHRRGAMVLPFAATADPSHQKRSSKPALNRSKQLTFAHVPIAESDETKHFKVIGTTGSGKSTAIAELLLRSGSR